ncbi:MAG: Ribosome protection-type tetracycline resistance related proteins [uncultured Thermomicrobiales bacterium]|uniref:Ribosome protection-type tetracycline resistance related proteins n=1 Tax=uncultured Thermomicrobiales bacterium TaxID=1645740 RepID=A0A6J4U4Q8_9BACT|nr:MAG: Ribosome protection-type tetracycline resistance related proteins [uncultured Thermomicrobiales bacterium]
MGIINLGILAHVDAGKTSLTERLLFETGVIPAIGSVDRGSTQTDTLELERQRGITIQAAVVSFPLGGHKVNLIDTPGHADFIAEVERSLLALDGVILVVSAVEGIQPQTRKLIRVVRELAMPVILFINKIDRVGARGAPLLDDIRRSLGLPVLPMTEPLGMGTREATVAERNLYAPDEVGPVCDLLSLRSDAFVADYLRSGGPPPRRRVEREIARQARRGDIVPVFFGSAITGAGIAPLLPAITRYLPLARGDRESEPSGIIFKIQRQPSGEKVALVRLWQGRIEVRDRIVVTRSTGDGPGEIFEARVTAIDAFEAGDRRPVDAVATGDIGRLHGLRAGRIGDVIGLAPVPRAAGRFDRPTLESVVRPVETGRATELAIALQTLAEQDPLIDVRRDAVRSQVSIRLYGEVQKEVIGATLANDFGLPVTFEPSRVVCIETPAGQGWAVEYIGAEDNQFLATVGIRVAPGDPGSGIAFSRPAGALDLSFYRAIEESVHETLDQGLHGWAVADCRVTVTDTAMSPTSVAADYRKLVPLVLMAALKRAGTVVHEPVQRFELDCPAGVLSDVLLAVTAARGLVEGTTTDGERSRIAGTIPSAGVRLVEQRLPGLAGGEAGLSTEFAGYRPVTGEPPCRPRTDADPLDRKQYLLAVGRT